MGNGTRWSKGIIVEKNYSNSTLFFVAFSRTIAPIALWTFLSLTPHLPRGPHLFPESPIQPPTALRRAPSPSRRATGTTKSASSFSPVPRRPRRPRSTQSVAPRHRDGQIRLPGVPRTATVGKEDNGDGRRGSGGDEGHGGNVRPGPELGQILRRCRNAKTGLDAVLEPHPSGRAAQAVANSSALGATPPCPVRALAVGYCPLRAVVGERGDLVEGAALAVDEEDRKSVV